MENSKFEVIKKRLDSCITHEDEAIGVALHRLADDALNYFVLKMLVESPAQLEVLKEIKCVLMSDNIAINMKDLEQKYERAVAKAIRMDRSTSAMSNNIDSAVAEAWQKVWKEYRYGFRTRFVELLETAQDG